MLLLLRSLEKRRKQVLKVRCALCTNRLIQAQLEQPKLLRRTRLGHRVGTVTLEPTHCSQVGSTFQQESPFPEGRGHTSSTSFLLGHPPNSRD